MLRKDELMKVAERKRLSLPDAERDYLLEALLFALYQKVKQELVFKGGTALYKLYRLNRFSEDLDFTLQKHRRAVNIFIQEALYQLSLLGISGKIKELQDYRQQINIHLECKGPLYDGSKSSVVFIPLNISLREKAEQASYELLFSSYREIPSFEVYVMSEQEILAEKVRTVLQRDKARDVYDLWFLLKKGVLLDQALVERKLKVAGIKFNQIALVEAIAAKEKMWTMDLQKLVLGTIPPFARVQEELRQFLRPALS